MVQRAPPPDMRKDKSVLSTLDKIRQSVPKDQLLEYSVTDGWDPLCKFLGVPVPDVTYPIRDNHSSVMIHRLYLIMRLGALVSIIIILADIYVVVTVILGYTDWKWPVLILTSAILALLMFKQAVTVKGV